MENQIESKKVLTDSENTKNNKALGSKKIIALIGLMGVGKTTVGMSLAQELKFYFIDSDQEIEDREGNSITRIFASKGEEYFRKIESDVIKEIILRGEEMVLSLGGGAFICEETRKTLKEKAVVIWLSAPIDEIIRRVGNKKTRPLLNQKNKRELLLDLAEKRYPIYAEADFKFEVTKSSREELIKKIIKELKITKKHD